MTTQAVPEPLGARLRELQSARTRRVLEGRILVALHIAKAAGSTFGEIVTRQFRPEELFNANLAPSQSALGVFPVWAIQAKLATLPEAEKARIRCTGGNLMFGVHRLLPRPATYITVLRDPVDRVISSYYYIRRTPGIPAHKAICDQGLSLEAYVRSGLGLDPHNYQTRILAGLSEYDATWSHAREAVEKAMPRRVARIAIDNLERHFIVVGLTEEFDAFLSLCAARFGWSPSSLINERRNVTADRPRAEDLPSSTIQLIQECNALDMELYEYARGRLQRDRSAEGPAVPEFVAALSAASDAAPGEGVRRASPPEPATGPAQPGQNPLSGVLAAIVTGDMRAIADLPVGSGAERLARYAALAAANGQLQVLRLLQGKGADVLAEDQLGLRLAVAAGFVEVLDFLVRQGATPLAFEAELVRSAARYGRLKVLEWLQGQGCDLRACRELIGEIAARPALRGVLEYVQEILPEAMPLARMVTAIRSGSVEAVREALPGIDVADWRALLVEEAARTGSVAILQLVGEPHDPERMPRPFAALFAASELGHCEMVDRLVTVHGCDTAAGPMAAELAAENGQRDCLELLWALGAGRSPPSAMTLDLAALNGHDETFDYLTDIGGLDGIEADRPVIGRMLAEVESANAIYRPSRLWTFFNDLNLEQLRRFGMRRFKRCVNQNYFNYVPLGLRDPQLVGLLRYFARTLLRRPPVFGHVVARMVDPDRYPRSQRLMPADRRIFRLWHESPRLEARGRRLQRSLYRVLVGLLWRYTIRHDAAGLHRGMREPRLGMPIETRVNGSLVSQDLAHSVLECNTILLDLDRTAEPLLVAEVGAGYGRIGDVLLSQRRCRYFVFDIPPSLYISQWYLGQRYPFKRVFRFRPFRRFEEVAEELAVADIAFFTPNQIEQFPDGYFDVVINVSSLHEMRREQMRHVLVQMYRIAGKRVYIKQYRHYQNPWDEIEISERDYSAPADWETKLWRQDPVDSRFFEAVLDRRETAPRPFPPPAVRSKPPYRPTISIVLANYNDAPYLYTSLEGILSQTDSADELIVVDDGSTDGSIAVIESMLPRHRNSRLVRQGRNRGQHAAIQRGLLETRSEYVVWASADDLLLPRFVERARAVLAQYPGCGVCFSRLCAWKEGTTEVVEYTEANHGAAFDLGSAPRYYSPEDLRRVLGRHYLWISGNTAVARRDLLVEMGGFPKELRWHADWFAFYAIALRAGACSVPETLAMMRERAATYSRVGMQDPEAQDRVLGALLDLLKAPANRDLLPVFRDCPSLLSPFGRAITRAAVRRPRHWDIAARTALWHARRGPAHWPRSLRRRSS